MVADVKVRIESRELQAALARLKMSLPLGGDMSPAMRNMARVLKTAAQLRFRTTRGPDGQAWPKSRRASEEGGQTLSLTRRLRNSISTAATSTTASVGTNVVYAAIHQFGGIIRAKKGPFLAIPVTQAARSAGSPTRMPGLHVWQTLKGQFVMGDDKGAVHFLLRRQVTMPARPFLGASADDQAELVRVLNQHITSAWK
ncbi:MAG: phage virion morphogenesis protein [Burkholderiaceae bacterium]|jgi:phage virion morphogenesis protein|nr:phage virion morphogenesis protein [Burkholderiaceae bacterium]